MMKTTVGNVASITATAISRLDCTERYELQRLLSITYTTPERLHADVKRLILSACRRQMAEADRAASILDAIRGLTGAQVTGR